MKPRLAIISIALAGTLAGCPPAEENHEHGDHVHGDDTGHAHDASHADDTGHHHDAEHHADAAHHDDAGHEHDGGHGDVSVDVGPEVSEIAEDYCECMLVSCHDEFHARWGESDVEAISNCGTEISALPVAGSPQTSGNNVECYLYQCQQRRNDGATCDDALGAACM